MKRAVYDKQFKMAAVKMAQLGDKSVLETQKNYALVQAAHDAGSMNMTNTKKVRSRVMGMHFSILPMKSKNCKSKTKN